MDTFIQMVKDLQQRVEKLEGGAQLTKLTIPAGGYFIVQKVTADPATPIEGQIWENTTTHHLKIYLNGVITTII